MPTIAPRESWPACLQRLEVSGLALGGCIETGRRFRRRAHAHVRSPWLGWICVLAERMPDDDLALHELAHVLARAGHTQRWRKILLGLGGTLDQSAGSDDYHQRAARDPRYPGLYGRHLPTCPCRTAIAPDA